MTFRVDRTLPHHAALGLVLYTQPRRRPTLDDRTLGQIQDQFQVAAESIRHPKVDPLEHIEIERFLLSFLHSHPKPHGQAFLLRQIPVTTHVPLGKVTWATPNGRPAQEYLSEGISASHGMDVKGPTVALQSIARARDRSFREKGGDLINLKFTPANVAGEAGTRRLMQVIRAWSEMKHWHVQFNIINRATLIAAQKDPQKYRDLVVRIAGYSAYFVDLSPMQQAEIIARTEEHV